LHAADEVSAGSWDVKHVREEDGGFLVIVVPLEADSSSTNRCGGEVMPEALYSEGGDFLVVLKCGSVMEDVSIRAGVMVAGVVSWKVWVEDGEGSLGDSLVEHRVPGIVVDV